MRGMVVGEGGRSTGVLLYHVRILSNNPLKPLGWGGSIFLGESQSRIYPHMHAKFGRGPTVVSKKKGGGEYRHINYETFTSMSGTILPTMCKIVVVIQ